TTRPLVAVESRLTTSRATSTTPLDGTPATPVTRTARATPAFNAPPEERVSMTRVGGSGWKTTRADGVTGALDVAGPVPAVLEATTEKTYGVSLRSPLITVDRAEPATVTGVMAGDAVTV